MSSRSRSSLEKPSTDPPRPVVLTSGLAKRFGEVQAVRSADLEVAAHSIFGFLGPNGAGKTTTLRMLVGLVAPSAGTGNVLGHDITGDTLELRRRIGYLPQQPRFYRDLSARETLRFVSGFFYQRGTRAEQRIDDLIEMVGLGDRADRPVGAFSGGERQRLGIAQAQLHEPDLLILDEPAAGLDPLGRRDVLDLLRNLRSQTTVLYSTHILDDVQRVSDTVAIINNGTVVAQAPIEDLRAGTEGVVYRLTTRGDPTAAVEALQSESWVSSVQADPDNGLWSWRVSVDDEWVAEHRLLRSILADPGIDVIDCGRQRFELEDVFVRIVGEQA